MIYHCPNCEKFHGDGEESLLKKWCPKCTAEEIDSRERLLARMKAESEAWLAAQIAEKPQETKTFRKVGAGGWRENGDEITLEPLKSEKK